MSTRSESHLQQVWIQKMYKVCLAFLVILILFSESSEAKRRLDCTRFVFHPDCRGVAAKRSDPEEEFVLDPRSPISQGGADHFISNGSDDDFMEFSSVDRYGSAKKPSSSYDIGLAAKIWPHIKKALLDRAEREGSESETFAQKKTITNQAKLDRWSKLIRQLMEEPEK